MRNLIVKLIEAENTIVVSRDLGWGKWAVTVQCVASFSYERRISSKDLWYNIAPIINNTVVLCPSKFVKRVDLILRVLTTEEKRRV